MSKAALYKTDGGRQSSGFVLERRDCTVRSFACAADIPYIKAHDIAKRSGRVNGKGWWSEKILAVARQEGVVEFVEMPVGAQNVQRYNRMHGFITRIQYPTVESVARRYSKGRYILNTRNHAIALIDGVCHDTGMRPKARVVSIWEVRPAAPCTQAQVNELWARMDALEAKRKSVL
jgi:hypothetical protein